MDMFGRLTSPDAVKAFVLAGNATLTLRSRATGTRFTFRVRKNDDANARVAYFVSLLNGADNDSNFQYLGHVYNDKAGLRYTHGRKSRVQDTAPSAKAFAFFWQHFLTPAGSPGARLQIEIWHEGRCGRCGRKLTVPESVATGFGPECAQIVGIAALRKEFA